MSELFKREFSKEQLRGKHHISLTEKLNEMFLSECDRERRIPSDLIRIILEDRYAMHYPKSIEVETAGKAQRRNVA